MGLRKLDKNSGFSNLVLIDHPFPILSMSSRQVQITSSLNSVLSKIKSITSSPVRLVAVSKYIPSEDIRIAYNANHRHFGENYVQELVAKSQELPDDIKWHFIGALQSNKCKVLVEQVKNLWCVETLDSEKKARLLETSAAGRAEPLNVFIQVNTSGEERILSFSLRKLTIRESGTGTGPCCWACEVHKRKVSTSRVPGINDHWLGYCIARSTGRTNESRF